MDLFDINIKNKTNENAPLAFRMRPKNLDEVVGQQHIVGKGSPLRQAIEKDQLHSFILYGPPGSGKTTIAQIISQVTKSHFDYIKAVTSGVSEIRTISKDALDRLKYHNQKTVLFLDEIHRFNKSQQDVLLPFVEDGTLILIGATTENPLYELNNALLSRMKIYITEALKAEDISKVLTNAINDESRGLGKLDITIEDNSLDLISKVSKGDARTALNILDTISNSYTNDNTLFINKELVEKIVGQPLIKYDKKGDYHYDSISAFIKSIRGSDPDAALYWLAVMLQGGEDPEFIARRIIVHAAEDIGLADPNALVVATSAFHALQVVGLPEARIPLAQATIYLATAPKSNTSKTGIDNALTTVKNISNINVPKHIADNSHSKSHLLNKGIGYKYPHDFEGYVKQSYLPEELKDYKFYNPTSNGYEEIIKKFLEERVKGDGSF
ncbi:Replication-associated recombination protein RarA [Candidatus Syntrophocurvum alkaliphilum]|uniref:Replication-associated recombination protein RarA n=1 Tax=Candidatus Syntrophocurvum alkaliphilum TaxID=2293317 RepID=A0A6I6D6M6_9FIRM|nr:replication-associated recombination protein A [Candidatus Syntrophocurvum alkaliphilum]QGT98896.1 Replication-associated recombination protein RarA [Candidatus Syntrophocurvum alkaliphilum]